jgi:hypothetical protein
VIDGINSAGARSISGGRVVPTAAAEAKMHTELLDAVQRRVTRYLSNRDVEDLLDPAGLRDVTALLACVPAEPESRRGWLRRKRHTASSPAVAAAHAAGVLRYARQLNLPLGSPARNAELDAAIDLLNTALPGVPGLADQTRVLDELAGAPPETDRAPAELIPSITRRGAPLGGIDDAIASTRRWVARQAGADDLSGRMNLAELQQLRFERTGDLADLDAALATARDVLARTPESHPMRPGRLTTLGLLLQVRFAATGELREFDAGVDALQQACDAGGPDHEDRSMYLSNLGRARTLAHQLGGDVADLDAAVDALRAAVAALAPDEHVSARGTRMGALCTALVLQYRRSGDPADLDEAFRLAREAAEITPPHDHNAVGRALDLAQTHLLRHERSADPADAATAAGLADEVLRATAGGDPDRERAMAIRDAARRMPTS